MAEQVENSNVIKLLCVALYGQDDKESRAELKSQMYRHLRALERPPISRQAIKRWIDEEKASVRRPKAIWFVYDFLINGGLPLPLEGYRKQLLDQIIMYSARYANVVKSFKSTIHKSTQSRQEIGLNRMIEYIKKSDAVSARNVAVDLFSSDSHIGDGRQSYFVLYRPSTTGGSIVKTFLVCKQPQQSFIGLCSFVNFIRGGRDFYPDVVREVQGVILRMEKSYYWLGYMYHVDQHGLSSSDYQQTRIRAKSQPCALELIVTEYDDLILNRGLFPALVMTTAAMIQPIVSRAAMLHLGDSQGLQHYLNHSLVEPTELRLDHLADDLMLTRQRMISAGCEQFGRLIERYFKSNDEKTAATTIAQLIIDIVDNSPAATNSHSLPELFSAIESKPGRRSGTRPRP